MVLQSLVVVQVLEKDPGNVKALFRRAQAYMMTQDYVEAKQDLDLALQSEPTNRYLFAGCKRSSKCSIRMHFGGNDTKAGPEPGTPVRAH